MIYTSKARDVIPWAFGMLCAMSGCRVAQECEPEFQGLSADAYAIAEGLRGRRLEFDCTNANGVVRFDFSNIVNDERFTTAVFSSPGRLLVSTYGRWTSGGHDMEAKRFCAQANSKLPMCYLDCERSRFVVHVAQDRVGKEDADGLLWEFLELAQQSLLVWGDALDSLAKSSIGEHDGKTLPILVDVSEECERMTRQNAGLIEQKLSGMFAPVWKNEDSGWRRYTVQLPAVSGQEEIVGWMTNHLLTVEVRGRFLACELRCRTPRRVDCRMADAFVSEVNEARPDSRHLVFDDTGFGVKFCYSVEALCMDGFMERFDFYPFALLLQNRVAITRCLLR